jgi:hypothetical protein
MYRLDSIDSIDIRDHYRRTRDRGPAALLATRCYGGSASSSSSQPTTTQTGAGGQATGSQAVAGGQGSLNVGAGSKYQEQGALDLTNANLAGVGATTTAASGAGSKIVSGTDLANANINITDQGAVQAATNLAGRVVETQSGSFQSALDTLSCLAAGGSADLNNLAAGFGQNLDKILQSVNQSSTAQAQAQNTALASILSQLNSLEQTASSGSNAQPLTNYLYLGLAGLAVLGLWIIFGRKAH